MALINSSGSPVKCLAERNEDFDLWLANPERLKQILAGETLINFPMPSSSSSGFNSLQKCPYTREAMEQLKKHDLAGLDERQVGHLKDNLMLDLWKSQSAMYEGLTDTEVMQVRERQLWQLRLAHDSDKCCAVLQLGEPDDCLEADLATVAKMLPLEELDVNYIPEGAMSMAEAEVMWASQEAESMQQQHLKYQKEVLALHNELLRGEQLLMVCPHSHPSHPDCPPCMEMREGQLTQALEDLRKQTDFVTAELTRICGMMNKQSNSVSLVTKEDLEEEREAMKRDIRKSMEAEFEKRVNMQVENRMQEIRAETEKRSAEQAKQAAALQQELQTKAARLEQAIAQKAQKVKTEEMNPLVERQATKTVLKPKTVGIRAGSNRGSEEKLVLNAVAKPTISFKPTISMVKRYVPSISVIDQSRHQLPKAKPRLQDLGSSAYQKERLPFTVRRVNVKETVTIQQPARTQVTDMSSRMPTLTTYRRPNNVNFVRWR